MGQLKKRTKHHDGGDRKKVRTAKKDDEAKPDTIAPTTIEMELAEKPFIEMQIEALLEESKITSFKRIDNFIDELEKRLTRIESLSCKTRPKEINSVRLPLIRRPAGILYAKKYNFEAPAKLDVVGGYPLAGALGTGINVDLAVKIPVPCLNGKDFKNHRYHYKRAFYLSYLAKSLAKSSMPDLIGKLEYRYFQGDFLKPVLLIQPKDDKLRKVATFQLFAYPSEHPKLKITNLHPSVCNVDPDWWKCESKEYEKGQDDEEVSARNNIHTSLYNSSIAMDFEMMSNLDLMITDTSEDPSIIDAIILTKIWLMKRELKDHFSFIVSIFVAHLQTKRAIHKNMSCFQIFKIIVKSLMESNWDTEGLSFYEDSKEKTSSFKPHFPVVFLSPSGHMNLCYNITLDLYYRLRHEAQISHALLDCCNPEAFDSLFINSVDFINKYDVVIHLPNYNKGLPEKLDSVEEILNSVGANTRQHSSKILDLIRRALNDRIHLAQTCLDHLLINKRWDFRELPVDPSRQKNLTYGLLLDSEKSLRQIDKGPDAQSDEANEFRVFWEPKCELRRFGDGSITETVVWHANKFSQRRKILQYALQHILKKHAKIKDVTIYHTQLERFVNLSHISFQNEPPVGEKKETDEQSNRDNVIGTGEETFSQALDAYNSLSKILRSVEGLKHTINTIQPISSSLRGCSTFPPLPVDLQPRSLKLRSRSGCYFFPKKFSKINRILDLVPVDILVTLEGGGSWPSDNHALQAAKMDYLINLGEILKETHNLCIKISKNCLDVIYSEFIFRINIKCPKEMVLLNQMRSLKPAEYHAKQIRLEILPRVTAALDNLNRRKPTFGLSCRIVKRWLSSQLMYDQLDDIVIDLLVAYTFLQPEPYTEPASSLCGFKRFLQLVCLHDWKLTPIIVNFDKDLKMDEIKKIRDNAINNREKYPPMMLCTPYEHIMSPWTKEKPSLPVLDLLTRLCKKASSYICDMTSKPITEETPEDLQALFRPSFKLFNILIRLRSEVIQNFFLTIEAPNYKLHASARGVESASKRSMPIVGFNAVRRYVEELKRHFSEVALFFYDEYGQKTIGVVMKPNSEKFFDGDSKKLFDGFKRLGEGLVDSIVAVAGQ